MKHLLPLLLTIPFLLSACGANLLGSVTPDDAENSQQELQQEEQTQESQPAAAEFRAGDSLSLPGFSVAGQVMDLDGELIAIYEYDSDEAAEADQAKVSDDGQTIDGNKMAWTGPVHFFRSGRVMVVYVGNNDSLLKKLSANGTGQFAGN